MRPLILVTGFGPFLGHAVNPSEQLAQRVAQVQHPTHDFSVLAPLPVEHARAADLTRRAAKERDAVAILSLGLAATSNQIRLESVARNRSCAKDPDAGGVVAGEGPILPGAPELMRTPLDLGAIARALEANGIPWAPSDDAGGYVCNDLYFRLLEAHARGTAPPAAFVHLPVDAHEIPRLADSLAEGVVHSLLQLELARLPRA